MTNKFRFTLFAMAAALGLFSCSDKLTDDGLANKPLEDDGNYVYVSAAISLPTASGMRSTTDDTGETNSDGKNNGGTTSGDDYEYGWEYENDVRSMLLVIADEDDKYIAHTVVKGITQTPVPNSKFDFVVNGEIKHTDLEAAYATGGLLNTKQNVNIYAFCNYTARLLKLFEEGEDGNGDRSNWMNWNGELEENASPAGHTPSISNTIWAKNSFLMSNANTFNTVFPDNIDEWDNYADKNSPYKLTQDGDQTANLSPIKVERAAARIDFRDASVNKDQIYKLIVQTTKKEETTSPEEDTVGDENTGAEDSQSPEYNEANLFSVKLTRMALVNMSNKFYYLRRVSDNGQDKDANNTNNWEISGTETPTNFVVDVDAEEKLAVEGIKPSTAGNHFNFTLFDTNDEAPAYNNTGWYADEIKKVLEGANDTWNGTSNGVKTEYKIWRYVTENTIPATITPSATEGENPTVDVSQQKTVQSTGVVFKGAIIAGDDIEGNVSEAVRKALNIAAGGDELDENNTKINKEEYDYPILYSYDNKLYAGIEELIEAAVAEGQGSTLYAAVDETLKNWKINYTAGTENVTEGVFKFNLSEENGKKSQELTIDIYYNDILGHDKTVTRSEIPNFVGCTVEWKADEKGDTIDFMKSAPKNGITVYKASDEKDGAGMGYYCYYFYWNRHNDNLKSGKMGPMEFATVRNNVYKLAVTKIGQLGHPRITDFDPDPVDPEDPDEEEVNYIQVQVEVLPWVVRVNDIEF